MEPTVYIRFLLVLVLVLGLILVGAWGLKRLGVGQGAIGPLSRRRRLRVVEGVSIDNRHRAVLLRRDAVEHLVLLGPTSTQVIETGIPALPDEPAPGGSEAPPSPLASFKSFLTRDKQP